MTNKPVRMLDLRVEYTYNQHKETGGWRVLFFIGLIGSGGRAFGGFCND